MSMAHLSAVAISSHQLHRNEPITFRNWAGDVSAHHRKCDRSVGDSVPKRSVYRIAVQFPANSTDRHNAGCWRVVHPWARLAGCLLCSRYCRRHSLYSLFRLLQKRAQGIIYVSRVKLKYRLSSSFPVLRSGLDPCAVYLYLIDEVGHIIWYFKQNTFSHLIVGKYYFFRFLML